MTEKTVRVLVVDDSAYLRKVIVDMLTLHPSIRVVGTARDGVDALEKVAELQPDVVTLDMYMPVMDGIGFLKEQMARKPLPVVVCSILSEKDDKTLEALEAGAVEFVRKPTALSNEKVYEIGEELAEKVLVAASSVPSMLVLPSSPAAAPEKEFIVPERPVRFDGLVLGISTGGPQALRYLLPQLPANFPVPIAIVQHMPVGYTAQFAEKLNDLSSLEVLEAEEGLEMLPGRAILAQAGSHLILERNPSGLVCAHLSTGEDQLHQPSTDKLFESAAQVYGERTLGIVMTGMGNDGTQGAAWIKAQGGMIIAEDESSCIIYGMPRSVIEAGLADKVAPLSQMAKTIMEVI